MAKSSKYIQLSSSILMEYIYADQNNINTPGNEYRISTNIVPILKLNNSRTGYSQIFNADKNLNDTLNVRNYSYTEIDKFKAARLNINKITVYNDYDDDLTNSGDLEIQFQSEKAPVYDTIRLHLVQGFNFENNSGFLLNLNIRKNDNSKLGLLNFNYNKFNNKVKYNPNPFFYGGKNYHSYIEIKVLSTYNLISDYWLATLTGDTVVEKITNNKGILKDSKLEFEFYWIKNINTIDFQEYISFYEGLKFDLDTKDLYESVSAHIGESSNGDYIEFYGKYNDNIIDNFITDLNSSGYDYILLHNLEIFEYIPNGSGGFNEVKTDSLELSQIDKFNIPNRFRPIIRNSNAISYKINYTIRLYNRNDNSQIWKTSSMMSYNVKKYGSKLLKINLGTNPIQSDIYNKNIIKEINVIKKNETLSLNNKKYVTSFITNNNISISHQLTNKNNDNTISDNIIYNNGMLNLMIPNSVSYHKFTVFENINESFNLMSLNGLNNFIIEFYDEDEKIEIIEYLSEDIKKSSGEIVFRITEKQANKILGLNNNTFNILYENDNEKTFMYSGKFYSNDEYRELKNINEVSKLNDNIKEYIDLIAKYELDIKNKQQSLNDIINTIKNDENSKNIKTLVSKYINDDINNKKEYITSLIALQKSNGVQVNEQLLKIIDN